MSDTTTGSCLTEMNQLKLFSTGVALLGGVNLASRSTLRNVGVLFHQDLSLDAHVKHVSRSNFYCLLNRHDAERLVREITLVHNQLLHFGSQSRFKILLLLTHKAIDGLAPSH